MARVYLAIQSSLERRVALKVMAPALAADATFSKRFLREARTIASLTHPHIVAVYEVGVTTDHLHYFSMQFLPGGDFAQRMRKGVEQVEIVRVLTGIAKALGFAHQQGVVHRDVTPGNIMFDAADTPLLTDFGIARALSGSTRITSTGVSIGTSNYMSPEQARGSEVDARSDLYSLGALAFEALAGRPPYQGPDGFAVAYAHVFEPIPRLPPEIGYWQAFIDKALAKDPKDRFASADEFIAGLQGVPTPGRGTAPGIPRTRDTLPVAAQSSTVIENLARQIEAPVAALPARPWPWARLALILVLIAGLAAAGYGLWRRPQPASSVATPTVPAVTTPTTPQPPVERDSSLPTTPPTPEPLTTADELGLAEPGAELPPLEGVVPAATAAEFSVPPPDQVIATFLDLGQALLRMQRLQLPAEANATLFFARVLVLDPGNAPARAGLAAVVDAYLALSDADLDAGRVAEGKERLDRARQVAATPGLDNAALLTRIDARWNQRVATLREAARSALAAWRGSEAERAITQALTLVPGDKELTQWLAEATVIGKPGYRFRDSAQAPELVIVGSGSAMLGGTRGAELRVDIKQPFAVARKETSVADFRRFVDASKHSVARENCHDGDGSFLFSGSKSRTWLEPGFAQAGDHPVVCVSFDDASAYANWLSQTTGQKYRLLSEAEWQFLAGQVKSKPCVSGNRADQSHKKVERSSKALNCDDGFAQTAPVGRFEASAPGIYDIEGNVREWVADCANDSHAGRPADQSARNSGGCGERMIMGSAWHSDSGEPAVIARRPEARKWRSNAAGFRVARELAPLAAAQR